MQSIDKRSLFGIRSMFTLRVRVYTVYIDSSGLCFGSLYAFYSLLIYIFYLKVVEKFIKI
jgi:hypothetical protein